MGSYRFFAYWYMLNHIHPVVLLLMAFGSIFLIIVGRYFLIAGVFHLYFFVVGKERWMEHRLYTKEYDKQQYQREVAWSMVTAGIFSAVGALMVLVWSRGGTRIYRGSEYPLWWILPSLLIFLFTHETYYYWLHRWMHQPRVFRIVHRVHHDSHITSPWTAFSFHPLEGFLQAIIIPLIVMVVPIHLYALIFLLTFMTLSSVVNHLGVEIYPAWFHRYWLGRLIIGATHHSLHHKQFRYNYGLYFTFWDRWGKTESPVYEERFREKAEGSKQ